MVRHSRTIVTPPYRPFVDVKKSTLHKLIVYALNIKITLYQVNLSNPYCAKRKKS